MLARRDNNIATVDDRGQTVTFKLFSSHDCNRLLDLVGKQVLDLLSFTEGAWINCSTLEVQE